MKNWNKICGIMIIFLNISHNSSAQLLQKRIIGTGNKLETFTPATFTNASIPADFYTKNMGFFCKKELILEKNTKIPLRFRLGSLNYVNYLEGKKN